MRKNLLLFGIVFLGILFSLSSVMAINNAVVLNYGDYIEYNIDMNDDDILQWSFSTELDKFNVIFEIDGNIISNQETSDSGHYTATSDGNVNLFFMNADDSMKRTGTINIQYSIIETIPEPPDPEPVPESEASWYENPITWVIIGLLSTIIIICFCIRKK